MVNKKKFKRYLRKLVLQYEWTPFTRPIRIWYLLVFEKYPDSLLPRYSHKEKTEALHFGLFDLLNGGISKTVFERFWNK